MGGCCIFHHGALTRCMNLRQAGICRCRWSSCEYPVCFRNTLEGSHLRVFYGKTTLAMSIGTGSAFTVLVEAGELSGLPGFIVIRRVPNVGV